MRLALLVGSVLCFVFEVRVVIAAAPPSQPLRFSRIQDIIKDRKPESVEALIAALPEQLFEDYVLMRRSRSAQESPEKKPRPILFGGGGKLVVAYGGSGKTLEGVELNPKTKKWDFYEVSFKDGVAKTKKNPGKCFGCHQNNARPNWDPYALWPGAYGESESFEKDEKTEYDAFVRENGNDARYKRLPDLVGHYTRYKGLPEPNTRLTLNFARGNFQRIAQELKKRSDFENLKWAIAAASLRGCVKVSKDGVPSLPFLVADSPLRNRAQEILETRLKRQRAETGRILAVELEAILAILEAAGRKESVQNWSLAFTPRYFKDNNPKSVLVKDPLAHGLGGTGEILPWGLAEVDGEIGAAVKPYLAAYESKRDESIAARRSRTLAAPHIDAPRVSAEKRDDACKAFTAKSLAAVRGFIPAAPKINVAENDH